MCFDGEEATRLGPAGGLEDWAATAGPLCLGTNPFGSRLGVDASLAVLDTFADRGGVFLDTANNYGDRYGVRRAAERVVGHWIRTRGVHALVGTKAGYNWSGDSSVGLTEAHLGTELKRSCETLGLDRVDVFWLHRDDPDVPVDEICGVTDGFVRSGRARFIGCSNWSPQRIIEFQQHAHRHGLTPISLVQPMWSLARWVTRRDRKGMREMDPTLRRFCEASGVGVVPFRALARGFFAGAYSADGPLPDRPSAEKVRLDYFDAENFARRERVLTLARSRGTSGTAVCLAYLRAQPMPTIPIIGARTPEHVHDCFAVREIQLSAEDAARLDGWCPR